MKTGVFSANLAEVSLSETRDDPAEIIVIKKRTAVIFSEDKVGGLTGRDVFPKSLSEVPFYTIIQREGVLVDVYLPADAAVVPTKRGNTAKAFVIIRVDMIQNTRLLMDCLLC